MAKTSHEFNSGDIIVPIGSNDKYLVRKVETCYGPYNGCRAYVFYHLNLWRPGSSFTFATNPYPNGFKAEQDEVESGYVKCGTWEEEKEEEGKANGSKTRK